MYENDKLKRQAYGLIARWCDLLEPLEDRMPYSGHNCQ